MSKVRVSDEFDAMPDVVCVDQNSKQMFELAKKAAKTNTTVLITGETGSGKEILANYIHLHSPASHGPFVSVNCAALPDNMIESILFGHERGAFTNAINEYIGKFEQANHGTLLLDEIGELPLHLQAKLLRVLQERKVERLGARCQKDITVRIIAATNKDLSEQVRLGFFRSDLYFRLNVIPIHCRSLRERQKDILPLAEILIARYAKSMNRSIPTLSTAGKEKLLNSNWPGNVREMENVIQRALIIANDAEINADDLIIESYNLESLFFSSKLAEQEAKMILQTLHDSAGKRTTTAKRLNMSPRTLRYKLAKLKEAGVVVPHQGDKHGN